MSINKVFFKHKHAYLCLVDGRFSNTMEKLSSCNRHLIWKVTNIYYLLFDSLQKPSRLLI